MAENNNGQPLPQSPHPALRQLLPLVGTWQISGPEVSGTVTYAWMEGGFFLIQTFDLHQGGGHQKGVAYTGFDPDTQTLRSRLMGTDGSNYTYTYQVEEAGFWYWYGEKGSEDFSYSTFNADRTAYEGRWHFRQPGGTPGGYTYRAMRLPEET
ncbi:hypothetical protein GO986_18205 [Deinococcus sp. HMF7620]|uniref:DUF1579 domain-containing protein n=1 Tax=Deinococcus arboris TaxID=2682977 RepID=A0A7C9HTL9_9DEIO|nr:hypothetical protein [Deinococcus arboris]MVN88673.1 hypothetical protein [Deinococcus arboris]